MRLKHHVATALRGHVDEDKKPSNDSPGNLTGQKRPLMRPIVEFVERDWLQDASGQAAFNFETRFIERQGTVRYSALLFP